MLALCVYLVVSSFITCKFMCPQPQSKCKTVPPPQGALGCLFRTTPSPSNPPHPSVLATTDLFFISKTLLFQKHSINGIILYVIFWGWLFSLSTVPGRVTQVIACTRIFHGMYAPQCLQPFTHQRVLGHFQCFAIMNKAAISIHFIVNRSFRFFGINT